MTIQWTHHSQNVMHLCHLQGVQGIYLEDKRNGRSRDYGASALMPAVFDTLQHDVAVQ